MLVRQNDDEKTRLLEHIGHCDRLAAELDCDFSVAQRMLVLIRLEDLCKLVVEPPRPPISPNSYPTRVLIQKVTVTTAGTPVQGPDQEVPPGYNVVIRQRRHSGTVSGYVAFSNSDTGNDTRRSVLRDNDSLVFKIRNLREVWFDSDSSGTNFEVIVEVAE